MFLSERVDFLKYTKAMIPKNDCTLNDPLASTVPQAALSAPVNGSSTEIPGVWHHHLNNFMEQ